MRGRYGRSSSSSTQEQQFWDLLNEADSLDEEHPEYSEENHNGES
jgi:hypothetical protein